MVDFLKNPLAKTLNTFTERKAAGAIQATGRSLPCTVVQVISSGIVKVKFEVNAAPFTLPNLIVAKAGAEYVRYPTQVGDKGYVATADARLGGVTGLGAGVASLTQPGNLAALVWVPVGNTEWSGVDPAVLVMYGPDGVEIRDDASQSVVRISPTTITLTRGSTVVTLTSTTATIAAGVINLNGTLNINGSPYLAHLHSGVQTGGGVTGGVV